ncbi:hypothetical protein [Kytococcus sp. HMSC28H12]|uniref:hypothetical protein n=1 Tax=Kytococcus TaxID=57499 RepID=UPI0008A4BC64|nr:hypothetical protein [Kytococcus sp. HMSC28H12]OFS10481.1 hypothetical protein HMPREF3099_08660 [Kytococcus sp. HMSC28H12]
MTTRPTPRLLPIGVGLLTLGLALFLCVWFSTDMAAIDAMEQGGPDAPGMTTAELTAMLASPALLLAGLVLALVGWARREAPAGASTQRR